MSETQYQDALFQDGRNLTQLAAKGKVGMPAYRQADIKAILEGLNRGRSMLLVGETGVGKTSILHGVAAELSNSQRELWELPANAVLTGTRYLGEWQTKIEAILKALKKRRGLLYFPDVWSVLTVGSSSVSPSSLFDYLRPIVQTGALQLIGEVTPDRYQALQTTPQLISLFEVVHVNALSSGHISQIVADHAAARNIQIETDGIEHLLGLCGRFLAHEHGPGRALRLIQQIADYQREKIAVNEPESIDRAFVEKVFSIYSGLPRFVVSRSVTMPAKDIRLWFGERIIGQEPAIDAVVEVITLFKAGLHDPKRPIGTMLFVGPTGVGKTELAKSLARFLFGTESRLLRFDLSEFKDYHAFQMLVGNPDQPQQPARLLDPVRAQPFQVILLDEIEKAHANVWDMLLQLLDEGHVSPTHGARVNFRNTIVIATSNVGSQEAQKRSIGFQESVAEPIPIKALETVFRPELLNRFQHIVMFHSLSKHHVRQIARREIQQTLVREGIASRNLAVEIDEDLLDAVVEAGYDREYGARALKRQVQQRVLLPIAERLMESNVIPGSILKLDVTRSTSATAGNGVTRVRVLDSESSRELKRDLLRESTAASQRLSLVEMHASVAQFVFRLEQLCAQCERDRLLQRLEELDRERGSLQFWRNVDAANAALVEIDEIKEVLTRLDELHTEATSLKSELGAGPAMGKLAKLGKALEALGSSLETAERELKHMDADGKLDLLVAIVPITGTGELRDLLRDTYTEWARWRRNSVQVLSDPLSATESVLLAVKGAYAFGYLQKEQGIHRSRRGEVHEAVRVIVAPWSHEHTEVVFGSQRALKKLGKSFDRIRSAVEILGKPGFTLQNQFTIAENRELAREIAASWQQSRSSDEVVRRYDFEPFLIKDHLMNLTSGRPTQLRPEEFHELLCRRIDAGTGE